MNRGKWASVAGPFLLFLSGGVASQSGAMQPAGDLTTWVHVGKMDKEDRDMYDRMNNVAAGGALEEAYIPPPNLWLKPENERSMMLLVAIPSAPQNRQKRDAIRQTWKKLPAMPRYVDPDMLRFVKIVFFIGDVQPGSNASEAISSEVQRETALHQDIVRLNGLEDSYYNLTSKTIAMVKHAHEHHFDYMMKCDDDTFLRVDRLIDSLVRMEKDPDLYFGHIKEQVIPYPDVGHKWYMSDQFKGERYPPFMAGPAYLLGSTALAYIATTTDLTPYRLEDVAIGIYTEGLNLHKVSMPCDIYVNGCSEDAYAINSVEPTEQKELWNNMMDYGDVCAMGFVPKVCASRPCMCYPLPDGVESCN